MTENETAAAFEEYVCDRSYEIETAVFDLIRTLANENIWIWDISVFREVIEVAERLLESYDIIACDPYWSEENGERTPCYKTGDCNGKCPFRSEV